MPVFLNINGVWTEVQTPTVNVNGSWVDLTKIMVNVSGAWLNVWEANASIPQDYYIVQPNDTALSIKRALLSIKEYSTLIFEVGEWVLTEPIVINRSNITIMGTSKLSKLTRSSDFGENGLINVTGDDDKKLTNVRIFGFHLDGQFNQTNKTGYGILVDRVGISPTEGSIGEGKDINSWGNQVTNSFGVVIEDCIISNNSFNGIKLTKTSISQLINNSIINNNLSGLTLNSTMNLRILSNKVNNNANDGVNLQNSYQTIIGYNNVESNRGSGISLNNCKGNTLNDNSLTLNTNSGLIVDGSIGNVIQGNFIDINGSCGIDLVNSSRNSFVSNNVNSNRDGMILNSSSLNSIVSNVVVNNSNNGVIMLSNSENNLCLSNVLSLNAIKNLVDNGSFNIMDNNFTN